MMTQHQSNVEYFEYLCSQVHRPGWDKLLKYIKEQTDFYSAPASTMFHSSYEGGLLQHSLNLYECLKQKRNQPVWKKVFENVSEESLIITAILHDICKANTYVLGFLNQKTYDSEKVKAAERYQVKHDALGDFIWESLTKYEIDDNFPCGHGEKSVIIALKEGIELSEEEILCIRWHMGFSEDSGQYRTLNKAISKYPLILATFEADLEAANLMEDVNGNKEEYMT